VRLRRFDGSDRWFLMFANECYLRVSWHDQGDTRQAGV
jgi:hypothetical protein